jgi:hypothetical protein
MTCTSRLADDWRRQIKTTLILNFRFFYSLLLDHFIGPTGSLDLMNNELVSA